MSSRIATKRWVSDVKEEEAIEKEQAEVAERVTRKKVAPYSRMLSDDGDTDSGRERASTRERHMQRWTNTSMH
jgi:hypothetical protein